MDFIKEKLNIWRNYGFEAKEIRFLEFSLAEYNAKVLINCLCIGIPIMFLLICVRSVARGFEKANVWPMVLAIIIFVYLLGSTKDLLKSRIRLKKHIHELARIFIWTIYGMALYYDIMMRPGEINGMLCAIFIGMELIFAEYPENHLKMVLYAYLLTICVELLFEHGEIMVINLTNSLIAMLGWTLCIMESVQRPVYDSAVQVHRGIRGRTDSTDTDDADADPTTFYLQYSGIDPGALPEGSPESSRSSCLLFQLSKGKYGCHRQRKSGTVSL